MGAHEITELDALVVGAGFAGIYQLYSLRKLGYKVRAIDKAAGVGGTWYWNRYPGAMSDSESYVYRFTWDREDLRTYEWKNRYLQGPEIRQYLEHVVDRHDLQKYIQLDTELKAADWDAERGKWVVTTSKGVYVVQYLITALGLLSTAKLPDIPGLNDFKGDICHSSRWPDNFDLSGRHVGVIGNGSTGVQIITAIADKVGSLVSFQRSPQYSVPSGDGPVTPEYRQAINEKYDEIVDSLPKTATCFGFSESTTPYASFAPEKRQEVFESLWQHGNGFWFTFGAFSDITANKEANDAACQFVKSKIAQIVKDPEKAKKLMPQEPYARRPLCDGGYYNKFNRDNVDIVNLRDTPIERVSETGVTTSDGKFYKIDTLILATGFDAVEGSYNRTQIRGRSGTSLAEHWKKGPTSYLGCFVPGFPNLLLISGPQGPFANAPPNIETQVRLNNELIQRAESLRVTGANAVIEAMPEAEADWGEHCNEIAQGTLFPSIPSWIFANVPGSGLVTRFYMNGVANFIAILQRIAAAGYDGFAAPLGNGRKELYLSSSKTTSQEKSGMKASTIEVGVI
ncbi:Cyclohexanone 1,2-monooxygenase [Cyphellophora attinorum]|uniref:Cyclohexanone 1,2-monooxygenase n=1 Tax=Cyphellophora attinorum TaxID=1664694 RepID=A0A0N1H257_9EURO|nr:Cyclohexanone 1,2-monooxygenase [Phialophora attinorum]KPI35195.1 Cyclohexanone 1,2-monooxygenase [Phialophora attinorum]